MKISTLSTVLSALTTLALATPIVGTVQDLDIRATNGASCRKKGSDRGMQYNLDTWGSWDDDWGRGFLDNLRGRCGTISSWGFWYTGDQGQASFVIAFTSDGHHCVEDALWLASQATGAIWGVECYYG
ncbi:hypothetical protein FS842_001839 [Serendipita sp. 407]|nr:hypothetical protein FS842_001839 [Serendipita sp. 407]